ncbi:hypothetical protein [Mycobacterium sp.]|uniref:hypothetical protein n=1 Tax=Mycobacterium sp. TaxID=1785 RepID=UPI003A8BBFEC
MNIDTAVAGNNKNPQNNPSIIQNAVSTSDPENKNQVNTPKAFNIFQTNASSPSHIPFLEYKFHPSNKFSLFTYEKDLPHDFLSTKCTHVLTITRIINDEVNIDSEIESRDGSLITGECKNKVSDSITVTSVKNLSKTPCNF